MAEKIGLNNDCRELKLGKSFEADSKIAFHSMRYDFKPASVDTSKVATLEVGERGSVEVTVPHVPGSGTANTVYKGSKRPIQKECVLIIDHKTGEITLEKLASTVNLKKTRKEGSSKITRPLTPTEQKLKESKTSPNKRKEQKDVSQSSNLSQNTLPRLSQDPPAAAEDPVMSTSDMDISSSSGSDSSDSESDSRPSPPKMTSQPMVAEPAQPVPKFHSTLSEDLRLTDSGEEDSD